MLVSDDVGINFFRENITILAEEICLDFVLLSYFPCKRV